MYHVIKVMFVWHSADLLTLLKSSKSGNRDQFSFSKVHLKDVGPRTERVSFVQILKSLSSLAIPLLSRPLLLSGQEARKPGYFNILWFKESMKERTY